MCKSQNKIVRYTDSMVSALFNPSNLAGKQIICRIDYLLPEKRLHEFEDGESPISLYSPNACDSGNNVGLLKCKVMVEVS